MGTGIIFIVLMQKGEPMDDLISRADAIGAIMGEPTDAHYPSWYASKIKALSSTDRPTKWIPVNERLPEEHEWIGTKQFGTTISDKIIITFEADGHRFVRVMSLQNGDLGPSEKHTMDAFYKDWRMIAWMPLPEPYKGGNEE